MKCNGKLCGETFADVVIAKIGIRPGKYWSVAENGGVLPTDVSKWSKKEFYFNCHRPECGHLFTLRLSDCTSRGNWCPYCAGKILCKNKDCGRCFFRSFQSVPLPETIEWHQEMNGDVTPRDILKRSHKSFYFTCSVCEHYFSKKLDSFLNGRGCPYCNGDDLCPVETCKFCFNNSLKSHYRAKDIATVPGYNPIDFNPRLIRKYSNKKIWFTCSEEACEGLEHHFEVELYNVTIHDTWCPFCSKPPKRMCDPNKRHCRKCLDKSVSASKIADKLSLEQDIDSRTIFKGSHKKLVFICDEQDCGEEFKMTPNNAIFGGQWCPYCKKKTEAKMMKWLEIQFPKSKIKREWKPCIYKDGFECKNPDTGRNLPFDFYLPHLRVIIEIDGPQHFVQVHNWKSPEETKKIDEYKEKLAIRNGLTLIRVLQTDVYYDENDWDVLLKKIIRKTKRPRVVKIYEGEII